MCDDVPYLPESVVSEIFKALASGGKLDSLTWRARSVYNASLVCRMFGMLATESGFPELMRLEVDREYVETHLGTYPSVSSLAFVGDRELRGIDDTLFAHVKDRIFGDRRTVVNRILKLRDSPQWNIVPLIKEVAARRGSRINLRGAKLLYRVQMKHMTESMLRSLERTKHVSEEDVIDVARSLHGSWENMESVKAKIFLKSIRREETIRDKNETRSNRTEEMKSICGDDWALVTRKSRVAKDAADRYINHVIRGSSNASNASNALEGIREAAIMTLIESVTALNVQRANFNVRVSDLFKARVPKVFVMPTDRWEVSYAFRDVAQRTIFDPRDEEFVHLDEEGFSDISDIMDVLERRTLCVERAAVTYSLWNDVFGSYVDPTMWRTDPFPSSEEHVEKACAYLSGERDSRKKREYFYRHATFHNALTEEMSARSPPFDEPSRLEIFRSFRPNMKVFLFNPEDEARRVISAFPAPGDLRI
jgi:hypothetical protein